MKVTVAALCASLLLSVLMLARPAPVASAQQVVDEVCVTGTYVAGACEVRTSIAPDCDPDTCARELVRPSVPRTATPDRGPQTCPTGARGAPETRCYIYVAEQLTGCPRASVAGTDGHCAQPVASRAPSYECPGGRLEIVDRAQTCIFDNDRVFGFCPGGSEPFNGGCIDFAIDGLVANCGLRSEDVASARCIEPAALNPDGSSVCLPSTQFVDEACLIAVDGLVTERCDYTAAKIDVLTGDRCLVSVDPLVASCPEGFSRDSSFEQVPQFDGCYQFIPADDSAAGTPRCEVGELSADGLTCFTLAKLSVQKTCNEGVVDGSRSTCFRYDDALPGPLACPTNAMGAPGSCYNDVTPVTCSTGTLIGTLCLITTPNAAVPGEPFCPVSFTVFLDGDFCYSVVTRPTTNDGSVFPCPTSSIDQNGECRKEVDLRPGPLECENPSHFVVEAQCLASVPADVPDGSCPVGAVFVNDAGECRQPVDAVPAFYFCADDTAILVDSFCAIRVGTSTAPICAAGFSIDPTRAGCFRYEDSIPGPQGCPPLAEGTSGNCFIDVTPLTCSAGDQTDSVCLVFAADGVNGPGVCAVSNSVFLDGDFCYSVINRDSFGNCPSPSLEENGECRREVAVAPGPRACVDPAHALFGGKCFAAVPADVPTGPCPEGSVTVDATGRCHQPVANTTTFVCASPGAELIAVTTCVVRSDFVQTPTQAEYVCETGDRSVVGASPEDVICVVGTPTVDEGRVCAEGLLLGRSCVFGEPFDEVICPSGFVSIDAGLLCQGVRPPNNTYRCATYGDIVTFEVDGSPSCSRPFGPQPGTCPGVTINAQCYAFVDHSLACAPSGCVTSVPAVAAAPAADSGDVDCDGQRNLLDALLLARALVDDDVGRVVLCDGPTGRDAVRITAADVAQDGTVDTADARRLLQCLVDDNLATCAG